MLETLRFFPFPDSRMRKLATPTRSYCNISDVDFNDYKEMHLISDWDGVWVTHSASLDKESADKLEDAVIHCASVSILSNCSPERAESVMEELAGMGVSFHRAWPKKPSSAAFLAVFQQLGLSPEDVAKKTAYFGDRLYTDVYGARKAGIGTVAKFPAKGPEPLDVKAARLLEDFIYRG